MQITGSQPSDAAVLPPPGTPLLETRGIVKSFGAVQALRGVDFDAPAGMVTALLGDNGAGKSTLIKCIAGTHIPDAGEILVEGRPQSFRTPSDATHREKLRTKAQPTPPTTTHDRIRRRMKHER